MSRINPTWKGNQYSTHASFTREEDAYILAERERGVSYGDIAEALQRKRGSVSSRYDNLKRHKRRGTKPTMYAGSRPIGTGTEAPTITLPKLKFMGEK